jgi:hypothetical protein
LSDNVRSLKMTERRLPVAFLIGEAREIHFMAESPAKARFHGPVLLSVNSGCQLKYL